MIEISVNLMVEFKRLNSRFSMTSIEVKVKANKIITPHFLYGFWLAKYPKSKLGRLDLDAFVYAILKNGKKTQKSKINLLGKNVLAFFEMEHRLDAEKIVLLFEEKVQSGFLNLKT